MLKKFKLSISIISCLILILYLTIPIVVINDKSYSFLRYLGYILDNISITFKTLEFNQIEKLYIVLVWLMMFVIITIPIICLIISAFKSIKSCFNDRKLKIIPLVIISFIISCLILLISYYILKEYSLPINANQIQISFVKIANTHIWQPLIYISSFGSLAICGLNMYANLMKNIV